MEPIVQASGLVILTRSMPQKVLLLQHAHRWDLPKGHVDGSEDLISAALRETQEETGISGQSIDLDDGFQFIIEYPIRGSKRGDYMKQVTYFLGYIESPQPIQLTEHIGYRWYDWPVIHSIQAETVDPLLEQLKRYLGQM